MTNEWKILFVGDVVFQGDLKQSFVKQDIKQIIMEHDLSSCHFEAPMYPDKTIREGGYLWTNDKSSSYPKKEKLAIKKAFSPHLYQHPKAAEWVKATGFSIINLASNHIYDYGQKALEYTMNCFKDQTTLGVGLDFESAYKLRVVEVKGVKLGLLSFVESEFGALTSEKLKRGGFAWINHPSVNNRIKKAKEEVDVLVVQAHAGPERVKIPLPEWRDRYKEFIDLGADAVIAHHPHVPQGWELYNGKPVFYSVGNFFFDSEQKEEYWNYGMAVSLKFDGSNFVEYNVIPVKKTKEGVEICKEESYQKYLDELCEMLSSEQYPELVDKLCVKLWKRQYQFVYAYTLNPFPRTGIWNIFWRLTAKALVMFSITDKLSLLHNIRIESHLWTTKRALALLEEENFNDE